MGKQLQNISRGMMSQIGESEDDTSEVMAVMNQTKEIPVTQTGDEEDVSLEVVGAEGVTETEETEEDESTDVEGAEGLTETEETEETEDEEDELKEPLRV